MAMEIINGFNKLNYKKAEVAGSILLILVFVLPILTLAGHESKIYVNADASGTQDGSKSHPYKSIGEALDNSGKNTEVHVSKGTYKENIVIPKGVEVHGDGVDKVFIVARGDDGPVVKMKNDAKIVGVTVEKGEHGIEIGNGDSAKIVDCVIRKNDKNGINILSGDRNNGDLVVVYGNDIYSNGRKGVYSEKRKLTIEKNYIHSNDSDGIFLQDGVKAWIAKNLIKKNEGSGIRLELDNAEIFTSANTYSENDREGIEINSRGAGGRIDINSSKFRYNGRWGLARIQRVAEPAGIWSGVTVQNSVVMFGNVNGSVSPVIKIY